MAGLSHIYIVFVKRESDMPDISIEYKYSGTDVSGLHKWKDAADEARKKLIHKTGEGSEYLGWVDIPVDYDRDEFDRIKKAAKKIREESDAFVLIGVGGSYLGARAAVEFLAFPGRIKDAPDIYFAGNALSTDSIARTLQAIGDRDFSVNVVSKSGTTMEPAIAFRIFKAELEKRYGKEGAADRIYVTTDAKKGALKTMAVENGYEAFTVPDNIGGRYSVLSSVGMLPIAVSGADIDAIMEGAERMRQVCVENPFETNPALQYAAFRHEMMEEKKQVEVFCIYNSSVGSFSGWWRQLYGESEGKGGKGLFPACVTYSTDLHSIGQFIQDGKRNMFETMLYAENSNIEMHLEVDEKDLDGLNYLAGRPLSQVNRIAVKGTAQAHADGGTPNILISYPKKSEHTLGQLFYFFEFSCGVSCYMLGVNPFDQPGVEFYKNNIFKLLERPGY